jgi:putative peptidoglycan lipid II flippase
MTTLATLPAAVFFFVMPNEIIEFLFQRGKFTTADTTAVAIALFYYSWATLPMGLTLLTGRTFFSEKDTRTPAVLGLLSIVINYMVAVGMSKVLGFAGIAIATALVSWTVLLVSIAIIQKRHASQASLLHAIGLKPSMQMLLAGIVEAGVLMAIRAAFGSVHGTVHLLFLILGSIVAGAGVYLGVLKLTGGSDMDLLFNRLSRKR